MFIHKNGSPYILNIIHEFSRPLTRPDWRNLRRMTLRKFHIAIVDTHNRIILPVITQFVNRYAMEYKYYTDRYGYTQIEGITRYYDPSDKWRYEYDPPDILLKN